MRWDAALYLLYLLLFSLANLCRAFVETAGCNRTITRSVGWIHWTGRMGRCTVRIRAPLKDPQVIELKVRRLQVGFLNETRCEGAYVRFSDGPDSRNDEDGRYCGHVPGNATRLLLRRGPDLTITMNSDAKFAAENFVVFSAQFSILPARLAVERHRGFSPPSSNECPLECTIRNDQKTCRLASPGYPGVYPRGVRCRIALESDAGRFKIGGQSEDLFNLMNYTAQEGCQTENCEEHVEEEATMAARLSRARHTRKPNEDSTARSRRSPDRDEDDEFVIGHTSRSSRKSRYHRRLGKKRNDGSLALHSNREEKTSRSRNGQRKESGLESGRGGKLFFLSKGSRFDSHHRDQGQTRSELGELRRWHEKSVHKKSMGSPNARRNFDYDVEDVSGRELRSDFTSESWKKNSRQGFGAVFKHRHPKQYQLQEKLGGSTCVGDYLALLENMNGKIFEISKFCGTGHVPHILSRGRNVIVEFFAEQDGTIMHDGFQLTLEETVGTSSTYEKNCEYIYRSTERTRETIRSMQSWYPPNTLCSYRFLGKASEKISIHMKIIRNGGEYEGAGQKRNFSMNYCPGNEIAVYNGVQANGSLLLWSYCDLPHQDINNIQIPLTSTGNGLLIQYYSAKGSYNGEEFTYSISYRFIKKLINSTTRRQVQDDMKLISLRPVNFSALNFSEIENCNCDFGDRIGTFKNWFMVLVVLGVVSFLGAILTIIALLAKCLKLRAMEKKLLQTPKR